VAALNPFADDATDVRAADAPAESGDTCTPDWVLQTLMSSYNKENLKDLCKGASLPCTGTKAVVADRLVAKRAPQVLCGLLSSFYYGEKYDKFPPPFLYASDGGYAAVRSSPSSNKVSALPDAPQQAMTLQYFARLFKTMADPAAFKVLEAEKDHRTRQELDSGDGPKPWKEHVATLYNDAALLPERPEFSCTSLQHINPAMYERKRPSAFLKTKWQDVRRVFDESYQNYIVSGQSVPAKNKDVNNFYTFIPKKASLIMRDAVAYAWCVFHHSPDLIEFTQRAVPAGYAFEEGAGFLPEDVVPASQRRRNGKRTISDMHDEMMQSIMQQDKAPSNKSHDAQNQADNLETLARVAKELGDGRERNDTARLIRRMLDKQVKDLAADMCVSLELESVL